MSRDMTPAAPVVSRFLAEEHEWTCPWWEHKPCTCGGPVVERERVAPVVVVEQAAAPVPGDPGEVNA